MAIDPIPGIYNYCHRWCERCAFTARCFVYADVRHYEALAAGRTEPHPFADLRDAPPTPEAQEFFRELEEAQRQVTAEDLAEFERDQQQVDARVEADPLAALSRAVSRSLWRARDATAGIASRDPVLGEAHAVLEHYGLFIGAKIHRALHGYHDARLTGSGVIAADDDALGTAKVALLALDELMPAVEVLALTLPDDEGLRMAFANLPVLRSLVLERFPGAMSFMRPGFDDDSAAQPIAH